MTRYTFFTQIVVDGEQRRDEKNGWCALCTLFYTTDVVEAKHWHQIGFLSFNHLYSNSTTVVLLWFCVFKICSTYNSTAFIFLIAMIKK